MDDRPQYAPKNANVDETLGRLLGNEWSAAWKLSTDEEGVSALGSDGAD